MKKISVAILFVIIVIAFACIGCKQTNYKNEKGYDVYISDANKGYKDIPYYNVKDSINTKEGRQYFESNSRRVGDYLITDYEDGVCINRCYRTVDDYGATTMINIPEKIDNKPVVKLGGFWDEDGDEVLGAFVGNIEVVLNIPSTVKVITSDAVNVRTDMIPEDYRNKALYELSFKVDNDNPYYSSIDGSLFSKYGKKLLWLRRDGQVYNVPECVEVFEPSNGVYDLYDSITIGKNVKIINTSVDFGEDGFGPIEGLKPEVVVKGYKNTAAEKWAKEQKAKFVALKD